MTPQDVRRDKARSGHDVKSANRMIEVKGTTESWNTYNWVPLYRSEIECLKKYPADFWLYIVKFVDCVSYEVEALYLIPGTELHGTGAVLNIREETYRLTPISRRSLSKYRQQLHAVPLVVVVKAPIE